MSIPRRPRTVSMTTVVFDLSMNVTVCVVLGPCSVLRIVSITASHQQISITVPTFIGSMTNTLARFAPLRVLRCNFTCSVGTAKGWHHKIIGENINVVVVVMVAELMMNMNDSTVGSVGAMNAVFRSMMLMDRRVNMLFARTFIMLLMVNDTFSLNVFFDMLVLYMSLLLLFRFFSCFAF